MPIQKRSQGSSVSVIPSLSDPTSAEQACGQAPKLDADRVIEHEHLTKPFSPVPLKETDSLKISEFADLFGFPASAVIIALERQRRAMNKAYYSLPDLAKRWGCSRATVYAVLRESEFKILDLARTGKNKGKKLVASHVVEKIEKARMRTLEDVA